MAFETAELEGYASVGIGLYKGDPLAVAGGVASILGGGKKKKAKKQARSAARRQRAIQKKLAAIQRTRARKKLIAAERVQRSKVIAEAGAGGVIGSSAVTGAVSSLRSQAAEKLGFSTATEKAGAGIKTASFKEARALSRAAEGEALADLPGQLGITPSFASVFDTETPTTTPRNVPKAPPAWTRRD